MSIIARFSIPADQFVLGEVLQIAQGVEVRLESMVPTGDSVIPYFWVSTENASAVDATLRQSPLFEDVRLVDETETEALFRVEWPSEATELVDVIDASEGVILEATGKGESWSFQMRFLEREGLSEFYQTCVNRGLTPTLEEINNPLGSPSGGVPITDAQREALLLALEAGYFDVPRAITLEELAEQVEISDTAFSQRMRRGLQTLLTSALLQRSAETRVKRDGR